MAFILRRPFAVSAAAKQFSRPSQIVFRGIHNSPLKQPNNFTKSSSPISILSQSKTALQQTIRRTYMQQTTRSPAQNADLRQRLIYGAAIFGGTLVGINLLFNRETRTDGGMPDFERSFLNETFLHAGLGVGIIGVAARAMHTSGWSIRLMSANPWMVMGLGLAGSFATMIGTRATDPDNYVQKYALWTAFNVTQAALLSPLMFLSPALLARAGLYTAGVMGSLAVVGATAKQDKYLYLGGPLLAGIAVVAISGFAPLVLPATATRTLMMSENIWLYGGLAVFGGITLYDVQRILHHARLAKQGLVKRDAVNEAISLELDFINIFIRLVQILGMGNNRRR